MRESRRMKRMMRSKKKVAAISLTSMMDVFTILVFFLLVNSSSSSEVLETPKQIKLPDSVVEAKPRETVVILVTPEAVLVQGEVVARTPELLRSKEENIAAIRGRLSDLERNIIGISTRTVAGSKEITLLADKAIPFSVLKKIMSTCTGAGYGKISLAVTQKPSQG